MIKHVYLYKLADKSKAKEVADKLASMKKNIPSVEDVEVGIDFVGAKASFDLLECVICKTKEDFEAFCVDPYHDKIRSYMKTATREGYKVDYEI